MTELRRDQGATSRVRQLRARIPAILVWYLRIVGLASILGALFPGVVDRMDGWPASVVLLLVFVVGLPSIGYGVLLLMLAAAVRRRKKVAWWAMLAQTLVLGPMGVLVVDFAVTDLTWTDVRDFGWAFGVAGLLQVLLTGLVATGRREFHARFDPANFRLALAVLAGSFGLSAVLGSALVATTDHAHAALSDQALYTLKAGMAGTGLWWYDSSVVVPHWVDTAVNFLGSLMVLAVAWALFLPRRGAVLHRDEDDARLRALLAKYGDQDSLGYFATRRDKALMFSPSGKAAIAYRPVGGVSLAAGDPLGDVEAWPGAIDAWLAEARDQGWVPAVMGASEEGGRVFARHGLDAVELGDEAVVEVADFTLEGRAMRVVRQAYNRVQRAGYVTRVRRHAAIPAEEMAALVAQADGWRVGSVERGFSMALGRLGDAADGECVMVECLDASGKLRALLSFVPWGAQGLSLDVMRRDRDAENGLVEFMVLDLLAAAKEPASGLGVERVSLNFAMFRDVFERGSRLGAGPFLRMERAVLLGLSRWWQLESLYRANVKYRPVWEPRYLCFPEARDLVRIAVAAGRAEGFIVLPRPRIRMRRRPGRGAAARRVAQGAGDRVAVGDG